jgi:hypothetical protein
VSSRLVGLHFRDSFGHRDDIVFSIVNESVLRNIGFLAGMGEGGAVDVVCRDASAVACVAYGGTCIRNYS